MSTEISYSPVKFRVDGLKWLNGKVVAEQKLFGLTFASIIGR